ncbi:MAG TPA: M23 family metallopeptidase [Gemmatimonadaceae bacterium]|nr:M23 family metallopeptidase [Gemmatimonadaceae bacterium]
MRSPRRRWTLILVPPEPGARTHRVSVSSRVLKTVATVSTAVLAATGIWSGANARSVVFTTDELAEARRTVLTLNDSVQSLRAKVMYDAAMVDSAPSMIMPVAGELTSRFARSRFHPLLHFFRPHEGIDLSAPAGTTIVAPAVSTVTFVGWRLGDGLTVELAHNGGITTLYAHCRTTLVRVGQRIPAGFAIATVGSTGLATGPHVHFEVMLNGKPIDPMKFLSSRDSINLVAAHTAVAGNEH